MQHFNTDSKHAGHFLTDFWKTLKTIKVSQRWLTFYEIKKFRAHELGRLPSPAGNSWPWCHHISNYLSARVKWQQPFCAQAPMSLLSRAGSLNALWSTEMWDCLCLRAHESSELEPGVWRLPAPGWRTGRFFEFVDNSEQTALKCLRLFSTSCSSHLLHIKICYSLKHWLAVSSRLVALCGVWFSVFLKVFPIIFFFQLLLEFLILKANVGKIFNPKLGNQNLNNNNKRLLKSAMYSFTNISNELEIKMPENQHWRPLIRHSYVV